MKVACANPGCYKHTHSLTIKLGVPGTGKMQDGKWFCSQRCYTIFLADQLIMDKRSGLGRTLGRVKLGMLLVKNNLISEEQLSAALAERSRSYKKLGEILVESGQITERELRAVISLQTGASPVDLNPRLKVKLKDEIPFKLINEFHFIVFDFDEESRIIMVALYDMDYISCLKEYFSKVYPGYMIKFYVEDRRKILTTIFNNYPKEHVRVDIAEKSYPLRKGEEVETTVYRIMDFLNGFCIREAKIDNLEDALWIKGETGELKIDVYLTKKGTESPPLP